MYPSPILHLLVTLLLRGQLCDLGEIVTLCRWVSCVCQEAGRAEGFLSCRSRSDSGNQWGLEGASQVVLMVKKSTCHCRRHKRLKLDPWVGKIRWSTKWQPTLVGLPGKSHGQRSLVGYSPWGRKESDLSYRLNSNKSAV